jgi:HEAT repeat protein
MGSRLWSKFVAYGQTNSLELVKAIFPVVSSLIIAVAGVWVTERYNYKQLEVTKEQGFAQLAVTKAQSDAQMKIARNKDMVDLIAKLGSSDLTARTISAASLSLYGKDAVPPLIAALGDKSDDVHEAARKALMIIGTDAEPELLRAFGDKGSDDDLKAEVIYILGYIGSTKTFDLAITALSGAMVRPNLRESAAAALGELRDKRAIPELRTLLKKNKGSDSRLFVNIVWALGEIKDPVAEQDIKDLLEQPSVPAVRIPAMWALANLDEDRAIVTIRKVKETDKDKGVQETADYLITMLSTWASVEQPGPRTGTKSIALR